MGNITESIMLLTAPTGYSFSRVTEILRSNSLPSRFQVSNTVGEKKAMEESHGKNVEFYVKEGGKWLLLGDLTLFNENEKKDTK